MKTKNYYLWTWLLMAATVFLPQPSAFANQIGNADFESEIGSGVAGNWDSTNGAVRVNDATKTGAAGFSAIPQGSFGLELDGGDFTFQTFDNVKPGDFVTLSALAETSIGPGGGGIGGQIVIEFKKVFEENGSDQLISSRGSDFITTANANAGDGFQSFTVTGVAPEGTERIVFVLRTFGVGAGAGDILFDDVNAEINPGKLSVHASKTHVKISEPVAITAQVKNTSGTALNNVSFYADIPAGFSVDTDSVRVDGRLPDVRTGSLFITIGNMGPGQVSYVSMILVPNGGAVVGKRYELQFILNNGNELSERARLALMIVGDPVFDEGTIIGKVFNDENQNTVQDNGEKGVPWVKLVTEEGIVVITDAEGRYHIPGVKEGRHIVKIDGHSLPAGTQFITEETYLVKTTPGIMNKANFAVLLPPPSVPEEFRDELSVTVTQGLDITHPKLDVRMEPEVLRVGLGVLEKDAVFTFDTNYKDFIKRWYLEIRDTMGRLVWTGFGVSTPPAEVLWQGQTDTGLPVEPGLYSYQLKVEDERGRQDWTVLHFFRVISKNSPENAQDIMLNMPVLGDFNIFKDGKQTIPLVAKPTVRIRGKTKPENTIVINEFPVEVDSEGLFQTEMYTQPGQKEFTITTTTPDGKQILHKETMSVRDSTFFMAGLGEEQIGVNFSRGNIETAGDDSPYKSDFYQDGRLAYYLVGKIKGKFLVKSHYDTDDKRSALFTNLDPEDYYPIYGDASTRDYEAQDTQERFFLVVEMDRSYIKWGSFETAFDDTELASYNRTLSGLKFHYESIKSTPYGDPKQAVKGFYSHSQHRPDHNEFYATGGSLYYLRNRLVVEGSEKIRVEVRDKITNIAVSGYDLQEGKDYEIDYDQGRILLSRPLSSVVASDVLASGDILNGDDVYLVVDYEYDAGLNTFEDANRGIRGYTHFGDHIKIGATVVEEKRQDGDYDLRAVDATFKVGRNTKITTEYATSIKRQTGQGVSFDGGLSFANLDAIRGEHTRPRENAYLIKAESKPMENLEVSGYVQGVEPGFSTDRLRSQEGTKKYGLSAIYHLGEYANVRYRFDETEISDQLMPLSANNLQAPFNNIQTHVAQLNYDNGEWFGSAEYFHQVDKLPGLANLNPSLISEIPYENALAAKVGYHFNDKLLSYVKAQVTIDEKRNNQFGGGIRYEVAKDVFAHVEQMFGNIGDSTLFGFEKRDENGAMSYANIRMRESFLGGPAMSTTIGSSYPLSEKSRIYSERQRSTYQGVDGFADIMGFQKRVNDHWDYEVRYERRHLNNAATRLIDIQAENSLARANTFNTVAGAMTYTDGKKLKARMQLEFRRDQDAPKQWQVVNRSSLEYKFDPSLSMLTYLNYGSSRFTGEDGTPASFTEYSSGFAYRPANNDKLNMLGRYTYVRDIANDAQFYDGFFPGALDLNETAHILALDLAYDLHRYFGVVDKVAFKRATLETGLGGGAALNSFLWAHRFNFHVTRKWDVALEYRILMQSNAADNLKHGALLEIDREIYDYVRLGVGYNFTDFSDDLRKPTNSSYSTHGPFVRLTGKF